MFVTKNQLLVFLACVAFGGGSGVVFSMLNGITYFAKSTILKIKDFAVSKRLFTTKISRIFSQVE